MNDTCTPLLLALTGFAIANSDTGRCSFPATYVGITQLHAPYPNPATSTATLPVSVQLTGMSSSAVVYAQCYDMLGNAMCKGTYAPVSRMQNGNGFAERGIVRCDVSQFPTGMYTIVVSSGMVTARFPIAVMR